MEARRAVVERLRPKRTAEKAIILGLGAVAAYEVLCPKGETISEGVDRIMESKVGKVAVHALIWTTALHLTNLMPEKYDWLHRLASFKD